MDARAIAIAAADATERTPVKVWVQVGRTHGLTEIGTAYSPDGVPALLDEAARQVRDANAEASTR